MIIWHFNKTVTFRSASFFINDDFNNIDATVMFKEFLQVFGRCAGI